MIIRFGQRIRLTSREVERLTRITGFETVGVKSIDDLTAYVSQCKACCADGPKDAAILQWLLDEEASRCLVAA